MEIPAKKIWLTIISSRRYQNRDLLTGKKERRRLNGYNTPVWSAEKNGMPPKVKGFQCGN
jgi:hypothetical protein